MPGRNRAKKPRSGLRGDIGIVRLRISLHTDRAVRVPFSHQEQLCGLAYRLLGLGDTEYARFLHDEGYALGGGASPPQRRFKLFTFSTLRAAPYRRKNEAGFIRFSAGLLDWYISSPMGEFLTHSATGLLAGGAPLQIGPDASVTIAAIDVLNAPRFGEQARFTCWTPLVASVRSPDGRDTPYYLRPGPDGAALSEAIRKNLLQKYALVHGEPPDDDRLSVTFDADYLARDPHHGTKNITFKGVQVIGAQAPLTLSGSPALIKLAWECGLGEKNSAGFGMIEATR